MPDTDCTQPRMWINYPDDPSGAMPAEKTKYRVNILGWTWFW